jgi:precorrin-8X/cobalt-precorrin-8 methylmutase
MTEYIKPEEIEARSFEIIRSELPRPIDPTLAPIILRVIRTTADFDYIDSLAFSEGVIDRAVCALRQGATIVTDTSMALSSVDKTRLAALGGNIKCFIADEDVKLAAKTQGATRSRAAVDKAAALAGPLVLAVGNAPTALLRICELHTAGTLSLELVIGVPVGFVNVVESKEALARSGIPYIAAMGRKGGSNVAAAIVNALLRITLQN